MAFRLSESTIRQCLIEWRNGKKLHKAARERVEILEQENKALKEENAELRGRMEKIEAETQKRAETIEKLQKLLFERHAPRTRTRRPHESIPRDAASYRRPLPEHISERKTLTLTKCPHCEAPVSTAQSSRTRLVEDIVLNPNTVVTEWTITRHFCAECDKLVEADVPGVLPRAMLGPQTLTLVVVAKYRWNLPYQKIRDVLSLSWTLRF